MTLATGHRLDGAIARGQRVGRYDLVEVLGEGGMGTVWLAHPYDAPDQLYAVKTVSAQYASDIRVCTMFVKEASLAAMIDHPNVVRLYDVGLQDDVPFFVMEWIDGFSLRNVSRTVTDSGERIPAAIALRIASDLCGGLHAAHELTDDEGEPLGLVHRDVSPHNVLVTREGVAKLIDFGVAKARDLATGAEASVCGGLKGKVRYMAPEQALEKEIDRRADLFSVGAVIYQLLTGRAPFEGPNELAIINGLLSTAPVFVPDTLPEPVQWILRRALSRRPEQRFDDAAEMQNAIELALVEIGEPDTHADVAECLRWFDPDAPQDDDERASEVDAHRPALESEGEIGTQLRQPTVSLPPPPAYDSPAPLESAAPVSSTPSFESLVASIKPPPTFDNPSTSLPITSAASIPARKPSILDDDEVALARRAGYPKTDKGSWRFIFLAAAFVGALGIGAALLVRDGPKKSIPRESAGPADTTQVESAPLPADTSASPNTPIIDMGDLDEGSGGGKPQARRPRPRRPGPAAPAPAGPPAAKPGDLAGPIKVWK